MSIAPHIDALKSKLLGREISDELHVEEYLTHGTFGAVFRVADRENARQLALKVTLESSHWEEESTLHYFLSNHPNVVTLHENIDLGDYGASLLDYCPGGSLHDLIYQHLTYAGDSARIKSTLLQIIDAVDHCHTNYIYHRDLKPLNVLCDEGGSQTFLTDFGLATREERSREHTVGTLAYMSPECCRDEHATSTRASYSPELNDVWSLGVLFLELVCGDRIWEAPSTRDERFRRFSEDPSDFLRSEYPLNRRTRHLLLRIFSPEPLRISLKALRDEILSIDDFYLSDREIAIATAQAQRNAMRYGPWTRLVNRLDVIPQKHEVEDLSTDVDGDSSEGEFVDISLGTPGNQSLYLPSQRVNVAEKLLPCIPALVSVSGC